MNAGGAVADNVARVRERIAAAAARAGRGAGDVTLVVVTKTRTPAEVRAAVEAGVALVGENRVQEAEEKIAQLGGLACEWHLVGHLQRNKARAAARLFAMVQSLDSEKLADALERQSAEAGRTLPVLVEVNTSAEDTKFGALPGAAPALAAYAASRPHLRLSGLMTVGPLTADARAIGRAFAALRRLYEDLAPLYGADFKHLSMGMTDDFEMAITEGSNMVRVGRAIFGPR